MVRLLFNSVLNGNVLEVAFSQEKAIVGAFSVIAKSSWTFVWSSNRYYSKVSQWLWSVWSCLAGVVRHCGAIWRYIKHYPDTDPRHHAAVMCAALTTTVSGSYRHSVAMVTTSHVSTSEILQIRGQARTRWEPVPTPAEIHLFLEGVCATAESCDQSSSPFIVIRWGQCHVLTTMPRNDNNHISSFLLSLRLCMISSWPCSSLISKSLPDWYWQTLLLSYHWGWIKIQPISSRDNINNPSLSVCLPCC